MTAEGQGPQLVTFESPSLCESLTAMGPLLSQGPEPAPRAMLSSSAGQKMCLITGAITGPSQTFCTPSYTLASTDKRVP